MVREIVETGELLTDRALMWRARDEVAPGTPFRSQAPRSVLRHPYVIFYRINNDSIEVARVLHGKRNFTAVFKKDQ